MNERKIVVDTFVGVPHGRVSVKGRIIKRIHREKWGAKAKSLYLVLTDDARVITFSSPGVFTTGGEYEISGYVKNQKSFGRSNQTHLTNWIITRNFKKNKEKEL